MLNAGYQYKNSKETLDSGRYAVIGRLAPVEGGSELSSRLPGLSGHDLHLRYQRSQGGLYQAVLTGPSLHVVHRHNKFSFQSGVNHMDFWGLKGEEDLGNGMSAIFKLESNFSLGTGRSLPEDQLFDREAYVGLKGNWGTVIPGRSSNAADAVMMLIDPFKKNFGMASTNSTFSNMLTTSGSNMFKYYSPEFGGFSFVVGGYADHTSTKESGLRSTLTAEQYLQGEVNEVDKPFTGKAVMHPIPYQDEYRVSSDLHGLTAAVKYDDGPLMLGAAYDFM